MAKKSECLISIATDRCKGCGLCTIACPEQILLLENGKLNIKGYHPVCIEDMGECIGCGNCAQMCPDYVITIEKAIH